MSEKKHISYSAADIERYRKGLMTAKEMNALEKAALDDPFLADAIDGYSFVPVQAENDVSFLNKKIDERINEGKIIPIEKSGYTWLRVAAAIIVIAGAGILTYNYVLQNRKQDVATIEKKDTATTKNIYPDTIIEQVSDTVAKRTETDKTETLTTNSNTADRKVKPATSEKAEAAKDLNGANREAELPVAAPENLNDVTIKKDEAINKKDSIKQLPAEESKTVNGYARVKSADDLAKAKKDVIQDKERALNEVTVGKTVAAQNNKINYFRGQVMDANNSPLPFSNVTIVPDNIGTYTDAKGNFVLISPDSVLNVKVHSVGFENNTAQLQNNISINPIVLQQDTKNVPVTVLSSKKTNTQRRQQNNITIEEPEPADGWYNYDTYIANNIKLSDEIKTKTTPSSEVELSFDVNRSGEPVNIKVEKSVCKECDAEAIRLLKEGPKWKKKKKRAKLSIGFSQD